MKFIFLLSAFTLSLRVDAQTVHKKVEINTARPQASQVASSKARTTVSKVQNLLQMAFASLDLKVKARGGQDGGGGDIDEVEMHRLISSSVIRIKTYLPVIQNMNILTNEEILSLRDIFFSNSSEPKKFCVVISDLKNKNICPSEQTTIFVEKSRWRAMSELQKQQASLEQILEMIGVSDLTQRTDKLAKIDLIINLRPRPMHKYDIISQTGDTFVVRRNGKTETSFQLRMTKRNNNSSGGYVILVTGPQSQQEFLLDQNSPYFQLSPCNADQVQDDYMEILNKEYALFEFKPLVKKCLDLIKSGQPIHSIYVREGENLVLNCR